MEKERKGLFERLMDFWKEKIYMAGEDGIGFWYEKSYLEEYSAEMGDMDAVRQKEVQKIFSLEEERKRQKLQELFSVEKEEKLEKREDRVLEKSAELFREKEDLQRNRKVKVLLWEMPETERGKREPIGIAVQKEKAAEPVAEEKVEERKRNVWAEPQKMAEIDVEKLMQQITKKLWEEREGCGRRLR